MEIKLTPKSGLIVVVIAIAVVAVRFATLGESDDPSLRQAVIAELTIRLGGRTGADIDAIEAAGGVDEESARRLAERADPEGIQVHSMSVSGPLLSPSSRESMVVRVEYSLPQAARRREYWAFDHSTMAGWRYRRPTTALSYYLNFF